MREEERWRKTMQDREKQKETEQDLEGVGKRD